MLINAQWQRFISAEAAELMPEETPAVVLSFGDEESRVQELALSLDDVRDLVVQALGSLAYHGDMLAEAILEEHFRDAS